MPSPIDIGTDMLNPKILTRLFNQSFGKRRKYREIVQMIPATAETIDIILSVFGSSGLFLNMKKSMLGTNLTFSPHADFFDNGFKCTERSFNSHQIVILGFAFDTNTCDFPFLIALFIYGV